MTYITIDDYTQALQLINEGSSVRQAVKSINRSIDAMQAYCKRHGLPRLMAKPKRREITADVIAPYLPDFIGGRLTRIALAKELGCTTAVLRQYLADNKIKSSSYSYRSEDYQLVVDYVVKHGGCPTHAIRTLGLKTLSGPVYKYALARGIDLHHYLYAYQSYGHWLVLPGPIEKQKPSTYNVRAKCLICGTIYDRVCLNNLKSGKSSRCASCNSSRNHQIQVVDAATGEIFKSIKSWASAIHRPQQYQSLRIKMLKSGEITVDQKHYLLRSRS